MEGKRRHDHAEALQQPSTGLGFGAIIRFAAFGTAKADIIP